MKKRKELDALVANGKLGKRVKKGSGSCSAHELLRHDSETSDMEDFSILQPRRNSRKKSGSRLHLSTVCLPLCQFVLVSTCVLVSGTLIWLHIGLREDLDLLRAHLQKVEAGNRNTPEALHSIHTKLRQLDANASALNQEILKINSEIINFTSEVKHLKETTNNLQASIAAAPAIQQLPKDVHSLSESVASFGSKITALESTVKELKDQQANYQTTTQNLAGELETFKTTVQELTNITEVQQKTIVNPAAQDPYYQNAVQETNQRVSRIQTDLIQIARSVDKMNTTLINHLIIFREVPSKIDAMNDSVNWLINDTHIHHMKIVALENFAHDNLSLRLDELRSDGSRTSIQMPLSLDVKNFIQQYINKTMSEAVLQVVNNTLLDKKLQDKENTTMQTLFQKAHDIVMLYANLLEQFDENPDSDHLFINKNATEVITSLLNTTFVQLMEKHDFKIEIIQLSLRNLTVLYDKLKQDINETRNEADMALSLFQHLQSEKNRHNLTPQPTPKALLQEKEFLNSTGQISSVQTSPPNHDINKLTTAEDKSN